MKLWRYWKTSGKYSCCSLFFKGLGILQFKFFDFIYECFYFYFAPFLVLGIVLSYGSNPADFKHLEQFRVDHHALHQES